MVVLREEGGSGRDGGREEGEGGEGDGQVARIACKKNGKVRSGLTTQAMGLIPKCAGR